MKTTKADLEMWNTMVNSDIPHPINVIVAQDKMRALLVDLDLLEATEKADAMEWLRSEIRRLKEEVRLQMKARHAVLASTAHSRKVRPIRL